MHHAVNRSLAAVALAQSIKSVSRQLPHNCLGSFCNLAFGLASIFCADPFCNSKRNRVQISWQRVCHCNGVRNDLLEGMHQQERITSKQHLDILWMEL